MRHDTGNHELLAPDHPHHVLLQGGEPSPDQGQAHKLSFWIPRGTHPYPVATKGASLTPHSGSQLEQARTGGVVFEDHMYIRKLTFPEKEQTQ